PQFHGGIVASDTGNNITIGTLWDKQATAQSTDAIATDVGKTTLEMKQKATYTAWNWDFNTVWVIVDGQDYPQLRWQGNPAAALWDTFNEVKRPDDLIDPNVILSPENAALRSGINWASIYNVANHYGINWMNMAILSRPTYWDDRNVTIGD